MDEKDWACIATIFDEKNLTHAAEKLFISQPALTYRIRELEKELHIKIFVKGKGMLKFTTEGCLLAEYAQKMLGSLNNLKVELQKISEPENCVLNIAAGEIFSHMELPNILAAFHQLQPTVKYNILSINPGNILESLINAECHMTIIRSKLDWGGPKLVLRKDPVCVISKRPIAIKDLPHLPRINVVLTASSKRAIDEWWQEYFSVPPQIEMTVPRTETCLEMLKQDFGYAIYPLGPTLLNLLQNDLCITPLQHKDGSPHELELFAYYREDTAQIKIVKHFIKFLKHHFHLQKSV